jgi:hypothetical protein
MSMRFTSLLLTFALAGLPQIAQAQDKPQIPERHYRHYKDVPLGFYNSSIASFAGDNMVDRLALANPEAAAARARELKALGFNAVMYNGRHFRLSYENEWKDIAEAARIVTEACRKEGIQVIEHHEFTVPQYNSYDLMLKHLDWMQRDIRTGELLRWMCPNNPEFIDWYIAYLKDFQQIANPDAYQLDEIAYQGAYSCGCSHCRTAFKAETGLDLPVWAGTEEVYNTQAYRVWMGWRSRVPSKTKAKIIGELRKLRSDLPLLNYVSDYSDSATAASGADLASTVATFASFAGWENMNSESLNAWKPNMRALKLRQSYGDYYDIPVWSLQREFTTKESTFFGWAQANMTKHSVWYGARSTDSQEDLDYLKKYNGWKQAMPQRYARTLTDTGFLLSHQTRQVNPDRSFYWTDFAGWADLLLEGNKQFDTLLDGDLLLPDRLGKYQVLILASQACLSLAQTERLEKWVADGGTLIFSRNSSLYDEHGAQRPDFALGKAANIRYRSYDTRGRRIEGKLGASPISYSTRDGLSVVELVDPTRSQVLAQTTIGQPAVVETAHGGGRFIYVASDIGTGRMEMEFRNNRVHSVWDDKGEGLNFINSLYNYAHNAAEPLQFDLPKGVVGLGYQQQGGVNNGEIHLHLLNVSGKNLPHGYKSVYGKEEAIPLPPVTQPLKINLKAQITGEVLLQSPMHQVREKADVRKNEDGSSTITLPGAALVDYLQITVPAQPVPGQKLLDVPLLPALAGGVQ